MQINEEEKNYIGKETGLQSNRHFIIYCVGLLPQGVPCEIVA